jgi:protection of telomeres protein 1
MTNRSTVISVFDAKKLSEPSATASSAMTVTFPKGKSLPSKNEWDYALKLFRGIDKYRVPTEHEFRTRQIQSHAVKDKFSLLQDVKDFHFYDVIVHIVKEPFDLGDKSTLWVSDYTENVDFFNHAFTSTGQTESGQKDPYGYGAYVSSQSQWTGPFGKRSFQITCWEPHASALRTGQITKGSWVLIRNLQVKYGHNGTNLEGFLREDRDKAAKIGVILLEHLSDSESMDPRLKEAIRRRRDYDRSKRDQLRILEEAAEAGRKRKLHHDMHDLGSRPAKGAKAKRQKSRAERFGKLEEVESKMSNFDIVAAQNLESPRAPTADLNSHGMTYIFDLD